MSPQEINSLRQRVLSGEKVPPEELAAALKTLRGNRSVAGASATASRTKKAPLSPEESQAELDGLFGEIGL